MLREEKRRLYDTKYRDTVTVFRLWWMMMDFLIILAVGFGLLLVTNILNRLLVNQKEIKEKKERINEINKEMKEKQKTNPEEAKKLLGEVLRQNNAIFRMSLKPLLVSMIFIVITLPFLHNTYGDQFLEMNATEVKINNSVFAL